MHFPEEWEPAMSTDLLTADFDYHLPEELIASRPLERRDASRMMVVRRDGGSVEHRRFCDFPDLARGFLTVLNDTRVARARFFSNDGRTELLRLAEVEPLLWHCLAKPGKRLKPGTPVQIGASTGVVESVRADGSRMIRFDSAVDAQQHGHLALPHYMNRGDDAADAERYQTVFADAAREKAIAAPTAGLHFTPEILAGVEHVCVTLHVGVGTFQPVREERIADHVMHGEEYLISPSAAAAVNGAQNLLAVGTTVTRVLEHQFRQYGQALAGEGSTDIFIVPGFVFRRVNALLTNFHLPKSTLFMLVCAFGGMDVMRRAYAEAVAQRYRFYSYGDCMLIL